MTPTIEQIRAMAERLKAQADDEREWGEGRGDMCDEAAAMLLALAEQRPVVWVPACDIEPVADDEEFIETQLWFKQIGGCVPLYAAPLAATESERSERNAALEEAARMCESLPVKFPYDVSDIQRCAASIRALKSPPAAEKP